MNFLFYDIILFILFTVATVLFLYMHKKNVKREGIVFLYRSKFGLKFMDNISKKYPKLLNFLSTAYIIIGFLGMIIVMLLLIYSIYNMFIAIKVQSIPPIVPLLPWMQIPGFPTLYFSFWIISIFVLVVVHEGSHGIFARYNKIKVKNSGFGFLGPLPLAFVEPDEKQLAKKSTRAQLSVFAAGPAANFITALIVLLLISFVLNPLIAASIKDSKIIIEQVQNDTPAYYSGIEKGDMISLNGSDAIIDFSKFVSGLKPNQTISILIKNKNKIVNLTTTKHPLNETAGYLGVGITPELEGLEKAIPFLSGLFFWIWITNFFVGLFNLMPFCIVDGGRMFYSAALHLTKSKNKAQKAMKIATFFCLFLFFLIFLVWLLKSFILI